MSTAGRPDASAPAESLAAVCRSAGFVRLVATADGDALAALGQLGAALRATDVPFQASVRRVPDERGTDADATVVLGTDAAADMAVTEGPLAATAYDATRELGVAPAPLLALAGAVAGGYTPGGDTPLYEAAERRLDRRPGVALPVADLADGLAHTTLVHAGFSGSPDDAAAALADLDLPADLGDDARRRLASLVALRAVENTPDRAAETVERALRPYTGGPFRTLGGFADVLDACARTAPGVGVALAIEAARAEAGAGGENLAHASEARDAWHAHGAAAHAALRSADPARHSGLVVVRADGGAPLGTVARLAHGYRSPEPLVLAAGGEGAALYGERAADLARGVADVTGAAWSGRDTTGTLVGIDATTAAQEVRAAL
jgi:hypothetical protein